MREQIEVILDKVAPTLKNKSQWVEALLIYLPKFKITEKEHVAMFLAQAAHESGHFMHMTENLNYSSKGLRNTWPSRFPSDAIALKYARQPRAIANKVYADRMGNSGEASGDGWNYRGRGIFQLTGKSNYLRLSKAVEIDFVSNPDMLTQVSEAVISACWYWNEGNPTGKSLNTLCPDIKKVTKAINGGYIGLPDREKLYHLILSILK